MRMYHEEDMKTMVRQMHALQMKRLPDQQKLQETYVLSDQFYVRMRPLLKRMERREKSARMRGYGISAAAAAVLVISLIYPKEAADAARRVMVWMDKFAKIQFKEETDVSRIPEYTLGYVPDGYEVVSDEYDFITGVINYTNETNELTFIYCISDAEQQNNNEGVNFSILRMEDGKEIYYFEAKDKGVESDMTWLSEDGNVSFSIIGSFSKDEMLKIVYGVTEK